MDPTALAVRSNENPAVVAVLLDAGADPKAQAKDGGTAWDWIQQNENLKDTAVYWRLNDLRYE